MHWKLIIILILLPLLVILALQNYGVVNVKFLLWSFKTSKAIVILFSLLAGFIIGWLFSLINRR